MTPDSAPVKKATYKAIIIPGYPTVNPISTANQISPSPIARPFEKNQSKKKNKPAQKEGIA